MSGFTLPASVFLSTRVTDMRKSIDGLCGEVHNYLGWESMDRSLFVFYNRRRDNLFWDRDGYWVLYKRLEVGTFQMPALSDGTKHIALTGEKLQLILYGIDLESVRHRKKISRRFIKQLLTLANLQCILNGTMSTATLEASIAENAALKAENARLSSLLVDVTKKRMSKNFDDLLPTNWKDPEDLK